MMIKIAIKIWLSFDIENLHSKNAGNSKIMNTIRPLSGVISRSTDVKLGELNLWYKKSNTYDKNSKKMSIFNIKDSHCKSIYISNYRVNFCS